MRINIVLIFVLGLLATFPTCHSSADIVLTPTADGDVLHTASGDTADDADTRIRTARSGGNLVSVGIIEFDLSGISAGTIINNATIEFELATLISNTATTANLKVGQYSGDGVVSVGDFADYQDFTGDVVTFNRSTNGGPGIGDVISIGLDTSAIQSIIDDPGQDFLGLRTGTENFATFNFVSNEGAALDGTMAPRLILNAIPEPSSMALLAFGAFGLLVRRKR